MHKISKFAFRLAGRARGDSVGRPFSGRMGWMRWLPTGLARLAAGWLLCWVGIWGETKGVAAADSLAAFEVQVERGVVFAKPADVELKCDVYSPIGGSSPIGARPAVLLVHGGAWSSGSRHVMGGFALRLAQVGFVAIAIDYRLAPRWKFPAQLDDVRSAICWVSESAESLGVDRERIGLFGYSAGGHLACLIGTLADESIETRLPTSDWAVDDRRWGELVDPLAICAGGPPCDLTSLPAAVGGLRFFLGGSPQELPEVYAAASPVTHASAGDVPTLFIHGLEDSVVPVQGSQALYRAQREFGVASEFVALNRQGHLLTFVNPRTADSMIDFFRRKLWEPSSQ